MKPASSVSVPHNINLFRYIGHAKNCQIKINYIIATDLFLFDISPLCHGLKRTLINERSFHIIERRDIDQDD